MIQQRSPLLDLTAREREVLAEIARGQSNAAIASSLVLSKRAVEKHINAIFWKLGLCDDMAISKRVKATIMFLTEEPLERKRYRPVGELPGTFVYEGTSSHCGGVRLSFSS